MIFNFAAKLYVHGITNAFELSPRSIVFLFYINQQKIFDEIKMNAICARVSQAEKKDFEKFLNSVDF